VPWAKTVHPIDLEHLNDVPNWRMFDLSPAPSAICPSESVLSPHDGRKFLVVFGGYGHGAVSRALRRTLQKCSHWGFVLQSY